MDWKDLARDNRFAVYETFSHGRWRTCLSRAYYAVYSAATEALTRRGMSMPRGRSSPSHAKLPDIIGNNLTGISYPVRWRLAGTTRKLYNLRIMADYVPSVAVEERDARLALGLMKQAFGFLEGNDEQDGRPEHR